MYFFTFTTWKILKKVPGCIQQKKKGSKSKPTPGNRKNYICQMVLYEQLKNGDNEFPKAEKY